MFLLWNEPVSIDCWWLFTLFLPWRCPKEIIFSHFTSNKMWICLELGQRIVWLRCNFRCVRLIGTLRHFLTLNTEVLEEMNALWNISRQFLAVLALKHEVSGYIRGLFGVVMPRQWPQLHSVSRRTTKGRWNQWEESQGIGWHWRNQTSSHRGWTQGWTAWRCAGWAVARSRWSSRMSKTWTPHSEQSSSLLSHLKSLQKHSKLSWFPLFYPGKDLTTTTWSRQT